MSCFWTGTITPLYLEDDAGCTSKASTSRVYDRGAWKLGAPSTDTKTQHKVSSHSVPHKKKVMTSATEIFSDSDLSNSIDSYSTRRSRRQAAKRHQVPSVTSPHTAIAVTPLCPLDTCSVPPVPQHPTMVSLSTTDQSSLTTAMVDQLAMIQQQSLELDELKASMQHHTPGAVILSSHTSEYGTKSYRPYILLSQEVAHAMASMTLKLNQFCFPAAQSLPASVTHSPGVSSPVQ